MHQSFGAHLRQQREKKGVSLRTIANQTKIKLSMLEGLERDDIRQWPAGIFRRAYVREYAQAIGLDPDVVVREFVEHYPAPIEVPEPPPPQPGRIRSLVDTALGSLLARAGDPESRASSPRSPSADPAPRTPDAALGTSGAGPRPSGPEPRTANLRRRSSDAGPRTSSPDLLAAARICTELGRVEHGRQLPPLLREAAAILDAKGVIVWVWDALSQELRPAVALGYPSRVLSQLRGLKRDADNATADAFRSAETRTIGGALVVPLLTPAACAGVLAIELSHAGPPAPPVMAIATFLAAMLAQMIGSAEADA